MLEKLNIMVVYIGGPKEADKDSKKKLRRCGMIANEITLRQRPNDVDVSNCRSLYDLQQRAKFILHSKLYIALK